MAEVNRTAKDSDPATPDQPRPGDALSTFDANELSTLDANKASFSNTSLATEACSDPSPKLIGRYEILEEIGCGGMGKVFKAVDRRLDRLVALKTILVNLSADSASLKRFIIEARTLARLQHPNVVTIYDVGVFNGFPYIVMEYLDGRGINSVFADGSPPPLRQKLGFLIDTCNGLDYVHQQKVVHGDIKPSNLILLKSGAVKIVDFGISRITEGLLRPTPASVRSWADGFVRAGVPRPEPIMGTLPYMSPEQVQGQPLDSSTDIFSMGVVFYELLTGHLPFGGNNGSEVVNAIINSAPPPIRSYGGNFPQEIEPLLAMALAKGRFYRYLGVRQFRDDLLRLKSKLEKEEIRTLFDSGLRFLEAKDVGEFLRVQIKLFSINPASEELAQLFQYSKTIEPKNLDGPQAEALKKLYIFETMAFNAHTGGAIWTNFICQHPAKTVAQIPANESRTHCSRGGAQGPDLRPMLHENNLQILYWSSLALVLMSLLAWYFAR